MAILPIDIQTILGQMNNVGKIQQNIEQSPLNQQAHQGNVIQQESLQKNNQVVNLEQADNEDKKVDPDTENNKEEQMASDQDGQEPEEKDLRRDKKSILFSDPDKGNLIDIKK